jgi:hypothetical protein
MRTSTIAAAARTAPMTVAIASLALIAGLAVPVGLAHAAAPAMIAAEEGDARSLLASMAGEWSGQVQVRDAEGRVSASSASASMRLENGGSRLALHVEGFAGGQAVSASAILGSDGDRLASAWLDSRFSQAFSFSGEAEGKVAAMVSAQPRMRQVVKMASDSRLVIELYAPGEGTRDQLVMAFTFDKLGAGEKAAASAKFESSTMLAALRTSQAIASVPE